MDHTTFLVFTRELDCVGLMRPTVDYCWASHRCGVHAFTSGNFVLTRKWTCFSSHFSFSWYYSELQKTHGHSPSSKREQGNIHFDGQKPRGNVRMVSSVVCTRLPMLKTQPREFHLTAALFTYSATHQWNDCCCKDVIVPKSISSSWSQHGCVKGAFKISH